MAFETKILPTYDVSSEHLTPLSGQKFEASINDYFQRVNAMGGIVVAQQVIKAGTSNNRGSSQIELVDNLLLVAELADRSGLEYTATVISPYYRDDQDNAAAEAGGRIAFVGSIALNCSVQINPNRSSGKGIQEHTLLISETPVTLTR